MCLFWAIKYGHVKTHDATEAVDLRPPAASGLLHRLLKTSPAHRRQNDQHEEHAAIIMKLNANQMLANPERNPISGLGGAAHRNDPLAPVGAIVMVATMIRHDAEPIAQNRTAQNRTANHRTAHDCAAAVPPNLTLASHQCRDRTTSPSNVCPSNLDKTHADQAGPWAGAWASAAIDRAAAQAGGKAEIVH